MRAKPAGIAALLFATVALMGAGPTGCWIGDQGERNDRTKMQKATVTIKGHTFQVTVAKTAWEHQLGLMNVKPEELGQDEGMLFVFSREQPLSFWMKNTITPLDVAFINAAGQIVRIHTMRPKDMSSYPSGYSAQFALEVHAGRFAALSIVEGDQVVIPEAVLKP